MTHGRPPIGGARMTRRDIAKVHGISLRRIERSSFITRNAISEVIDAVSGGHLKTWPAEKIARLPRDQQPAALKEALNPKPQKRPPWELQHDADRLAATINRLSHRWTDEDRGVMAIILHKLARQLAGTNDEADQ